MIAYLRGIVFEKSLERLVIDVGGIGYLVHVSSQTLAEVPDLGKNVELLCYTHVRDDAFQVFGFLKKEERKIFELLISVSGIGPKLALTILSGISVPDLITAIAQGDHQRLQTIPGVGKKTAERTIVELRDRCSKIEVALDPLSKEGIAPSIALKSRVVTEVIEALTNLGYKRNQAERAVRRARDKVQDPSSPEKLLRESLTAMSEV